MGKDPNLAEKAADVVDLHTNPPESSVVLSLDEKPSIQAHERPAGHVRTLSGLIINGCNSTYVRRGAANMFAALVASMERVATSFTGRKEGWISLDSWTG